MLTAVHFMSGDWLNDLHLGLRPYGPNAPSP